MMTLGSIIGITIVSLVIGVVTIMAARIARNNQYDAVRQAIHTEKDKIKKRAKASFTFIVVSAALTGVLALANGGTNIYSQYLRNISQLKTDSIQKRSDSFQRRSDSADKSLKLKADSLKFLSDQINSKDDTIRTKQDLEIDSIKKILRHSVAIIAEQERSYDKQQYLRRLDSMEKISTDSALLLNAYDLITATIDERFYDMNPFAKDSIQKKRDFASVSQNIILLFAGQEVNKFLNIHVEIKAVWDECYNRFHYFRVNLDGYGQPPSYREILTNYSGICSYFRRELGVKLKK